MKRAVILIMSMVLSPALKAEECAYQNTTQAEIERIIIDRADRYEVDRDLIWSIVDVESDFHPCIVSSAGAMGLMQLMPETAAEEGVSDAFDPAQNIDAGTRRLARYVKKYETLQFALAAYNAGEGAVRRYRMTPPYDQTKRYIRKVVKAYELRKGQRTNWLVWSAEQNRTE